jgi:hypothetical protein
MDPQFVARWGEAQVAIWNSQLMFEVGTVCGTEVMSCGCGRYLQVASVRTELNYRTPSWCLLMNLVSKVVTV